MPEGEKIGGFQQYLISGHNLPPPVRLLIVKIESLNGHTVWWFDGQKGTYGDNIKRKSQIRYIAFSKGVCKTSTNKNADKTSNTDENPHFSIKFFFINGWIK